MKKYFLVLLACLLMINFVSSETVIATEEQVVKMISNLADTCTLLTQEEIFIKLQDYSKDIDPNVATFRNVTEICPGHYLRYSNAVFFLDGKDISTICTETEIINIQTQIGNLVNVDGDVSGGEINQTNINFETRFYLSLVINVGLAIYLWEKRDKKKK